MTFPLLVAALIVIALFFIILPLLRVEDIQEVSREDQNIAIAKNKLAELKQQLKNSEISESQFTTGKGDLENALALDLENQQANPQHQGGRYLVIVLSLALPLASVAMYWKLGTPNLLDPQAKLAEIQASASQAHKNLSDMSTEDVLDIVKKRLKANPDDGEGWYILGRTFMNIQKYSEAVTAYQRSYELVGEQPNIMLALADALAMTKEGLMLGQAEQLVDKAIAIEPNNEIGLWLGGLAAEQRNDIPKAYALWGRLLPLLTKTPQSYNEIKAVLVQLKETFPDLPALAITTTEASIASTQVYLNIAISDSIKENLKGDEQVFVYAKAVSGPPMPLAAKKFKVSDLPINLVLSDADAIMPQLKLSTVDSFTVGARVSLSGNPIPQKGDFFMEISPLDKTTIKDVIKLTIKHIVE